MTAPASTLAPLAQRRTPCLSRLDASRAWLAPQAFRIGDRLVGVRTTSAEASARVVAALGATRTPEYDATVVANFSVEIVDAPIGGGRRGLHLIYRDHEIVARRSDVGDLLCDLATLLAAIGYADQGELPAVHAAAVVTAASHAEAPHVVLVPPHWHRSLLPHGRRLAAAGLELLPARTQLLDPGGAAVLVDSPCGAPTGRRTSHPLQLWGLPALDGPQRGLRPSLGVQNAFAGIANLDVLGPRAALDVLARSAERVPFVLLPQTSGPDQVDTLRALTAQRRRRA